MVINKSNISYEELKKELETGKTVIKFYADWCGPCNMLRPVYEAVSEEMEGITFLEVNIDDNREVTNEFGVKNIPTVFLVKDGEVTDSNLGFLAKPKLIEFVGKLND